MDRVCALISAWVLPGAIMKPPRAWLSLVPKGWKGHFLPGLRMPKLGQPRQRREELPLLVWGRGWCCEVTWDDFVPLLSLGRSGTLFQHAVPVALSGGVGRGMPVPIPPEHAWWDHASEWCCLPTRPWRARGPALHVREVLNFLPSSCFLPDGNSLPIFLLLLPPLQHKHVSPQR